MTDESSAEIIDFLEHLKAKGVIPCLPDQDQMEETPTREFSPEIEEIWERYMPVFLELQDIKISALPKSRKKAARERANHIREQLKEMAMTFDEMFKGQHPH